MSIAENNIGSSLVPRLCAARASIIFSGLRITPEQMRSVTDSLVPTDQSVADRHHLARRSHFRLHNRRVGRVRLIRSLVAAQSQGATVFAGAEPVGVIAVVQVTHVRRKGGRPARSRTGPPVF